MALLGPMRYLTIGDKTYEIEASGGSVTSVGLDNATGESDFTISGSPITSSGTITIEHSNSTTAKSTQAVYPITFDKHGHITGSGNAVTIPSVTTWYGTSSTTASTAEKAVTCSGFTLVAGAVIAVLFSTANTAATPTLNVNSTGAKSIYIGASTPNSTTNVLKWSANTLVYFVYDGTYFRYITSISAATVEPSRGANTWYGTSGTTATTQAKTSTINNFVLVKGALVSINFTYANTYTSAKITLNINSTGAKDVYYNGTVTSSTNTLLWNADEVLTFMYDGTGYQYIGKSVQKISQLTNDSGYTSNTGTVTSVGISNATNGGLSVSGSPVTGSGSIAVGHSNVLTNAQTTQAVYPIAIDKNGHVSSYGTAVTVPTASDTYSSTSSNVMTGKGVNAALQTLDSSITATTGEAISAITITDGKISASSKVAVGDANQNAFSNVKVGTTTIAADTTTDTLELTAGTDITLTPDATNDKVTIAFSNASGYTKNTGTVTSVGISNATNGGLSVSGSPVTGSGSITVGHSNVLTSAQTTQAVYPIAIDKNGHISSYGSAVTIPESEVYWVTRGNNINRSEFVSAATAGKIIMCGSGSGCAYLQSWAHYDDHDDVQFSCVPAISGDQVLIVYPATIRDSATTWATPAEYLLDKPSIHWVNLGSSTIDWYGLFNARDNDMVVIGYYIDGNSCRYYTLISTYQSGTSRYVRFMGSPNTSGDDFIEFFEGSGNTSSSVVTWGSYSYYFGSVDNVLINGSSIVSNRTANIVTNTAYNSSTNKIATMTDITNAMTVVTFTPDGTNNNLIISVQQPSSIQNGNEVNY